MATVFPVGFFGRAIPGNNLKEVRLSEEEVELIPGDGTTEVNVGRNVTWFVGGRVYRYGLDEIKDPPGLEKGMLWATVTLFLKNGTNVVLKGLSNDNAEKLSKSIRGHIGRRANTQRIIDAAPSLRKSKRLCDLFFERAGTISIEERDEFRTAHYDVLLHADADVGKLPDDLREIVLGLRLFFRDLTNATLKHNDGVFRKRNLEEVLLSEHLIVEVESLVTALENRDGFVRPLHLEPLLAVREVREAFWRFALPADSDSHAVVAQYRRIADLFRDPESWRANRNADHLRTALEKHREFFDGVVPGGLTEEQRKACVTDESRTRIIAGAGSGKTTTLFAKAAYLVECEGVAPERILAITYTKKSQGDLRRRFDVRPSLANVRISTIHALGLETVAQSTGRKPSLAPWVEDESALPQLIDEYVREGFKDPTIANVLIAVMLSNGGEIRPGYTDVDPVPWTVVSLNFRPPLALAARS